MRVAGDVDSSTDDVLVNAVRNGDRDAFDAHVDQWVYRIYDVALSILGSTAAAVEASRETIESLWDRHTRPSRPTT